MRLPKLPAAIACLAVIAAGTIAPAAHASVLDAQCEGTTTAQYSPGLTDLGGCDNPGGLTELSGVSTLTPTSA